MSATITGTLTPTGRVNTPPATIFAEIVGNATAISPGVTFLPALLTNDVAGTDTGAVQIIDQGITETLNSVSPATANPWLLTLLGGVYLGQGSTAASPSNTAVYVVFTGSAAGIVIPPGFVVSDGGNQYAIIDGGVTLTGLSTQPLFARCISSTASFAVPANTVTDLVTSAPTGYTLTVTNPLAGTPGGPAQTEGQYRAQVVQAGLVAATGTPNYVKTMIQAVPGVQANLVSVRTPSAGQWEIIVGGTGDPYAIAFAVFQGIGAGVNLLVGSTLAVTGITNANPGVVTTNLNHGFATGQVINIAGAVGISGVNGTPLTITVITEKTFSIGIDTTSSGAWTSGGVVTPNFRNVTVTINSYPDSYTIPLVIPPVQTVTMAVTWNTSSLNYVSPTGVAQLVQPALAAYVNAIPVGAPINELEMTAVFQAAVVSLIPTILLTRLVFSVSINGISTAVQSGTGIVVGDPESYFSCSPSSIAVVQG